jgi:hypothetical protein
MEHRVPGSILSYEMTIYEPYICTFRHEFSGTIERNPLVPP